VQADEACLRKAQGPGCQRCAQQKVGCSLVGLRRKTTERKEKKRRMVSEVDLENIATPFVELLDGFIEQMELVVRNLGRINEGIWALVDAVKDLVEVMKRKEASEMDGNQEVVEAGVQTLEELVIERVDKETEMDRMEEGSKGDEVEKEDGDHEMEGMEKE
jgi:putative protein kinase ArgK-like GTPase of G3E family